ncbi:hypothetical protein ACL02O_28330 [Micromonospora sp. MS34]|uniref:hypothetical protein n=1 Tax=Micromonospora sp. MS34 TaxID=3385971 RepID=UPI0039A298EA
MGDGRVDLDQVGGYGGGEDGQVAAEVVDLGVKGEPAAGEAAQGDPGAEMRARSQLLVRSPRRRVHAL